MLICGCSLFRIRIHLFRLQIQHFRLKTGPDPVPYPDLGKMCSWKFFTKNCNLLILASTKDVQATGEIFIPQKRTSRLALQNMKFLNFFLFLWVIFALHWPDWIRIRNNARLLTVRVHFILSYRSDPLSEQIRPKSSDCKRAWTQQLCAGWSGQRGTGQRERFRRWEAGQRARRPRCRQGRLRVAQGRGPGGPARLRGAWRSQR